MSASAAPRRVEVCRFPQDKRVALTTSWDDGVVEDKRVIAAFNEWGIKGTFNLNSGTMTPDRPDRIPADEIAETYAGHEVAVHTVTHPHLPLLDLGQVAREVLEDRIALEELVGYPVRGGAYPFGTYNPRVIDVLRSVGIVYCRTVENRDNCFPPAEPLAWHSTGHMFAQNPTIPERWERCYNNPRWSGVFFVWGHAYEFQRPTPRWDDLPRIFQPMAGKPDVWYCTNIELFDYEAARQRVVVAANRRTALNPSAIPVTLKVDGRLMELAPGKVTPLTD